MSNSSKWENNCAKQFHIKILSNSELESLMYQALSLTINTFRLPSFFSSEMRDPPKFCLSPLRHSRSRLKPHGCGAKRPKEGGLLWAPDGSAAFSVFGRSGFTGRCVRLVKLRGTRTTVFSRHAVLFLYNASTLIFGLVPSPLSPPPHQKFKSLGRVFFWKTWVLGCVQICRDNVCKALGISFIKYIAKSQNSKCQIPSPHLELNGWSKNWFRTMILKQNLIQMFSQEVDVWNIDCM